MKASGRIAMLSEALANQIAAGEVVQRPASVVKELLENSVDAHATSVEVIIAQAGKKQILVKDNGIGMAPEDARLCFSRHATSKIASEKDLYAIRTLGFRGEALAAIAAVAKVELKTRTEDATQGTRLLIAGSEHKKEEEVAVPCGTSISVRSLFFNTPARRNFLKSDAVEMRHIIEEFQRVALAYPEITFSLSTKTERNELVLFRHLEPSQLGTRLSHLLGKHTHKRLLPVEQETDYLYIRGYISHPEAAKKTRGEQFFFVNHRYVRHPYLHHAVMSAYERLLVPGRIPLYVLFIEIAPAYMDVNVHPAKTEIKFEDEHTVYGLLSAAVKRSLGTHQQMAPIDFKVDANFSHAQKELSKAEATLASPPDPQGTTSPEASGAAETLPPSVERWKKMQEEAALESQYDFQQEPFTESPQSAAEEKKALHKPSRASADELTPLDTAAEERKPYVFQLHHKYVCKQVRKGLLIVDQVRAYERVLYDRFSSKQEPPHTQRLIFAEQLSCSDADRLLFDAHMEQLLAMGFAFDTSETETLRVTGVPMDLGQEEISALFEELLEAFKHMDKPSKRASKERLMRVVARHASRKKEGPLQERDWHALLDHLFACPQPYYTPDGKPVVYLLTLEALLETFNP